MDRVPCPLGTSFLKTSWKYLETCLKVKRIASNFLCSKTSMRSWIFLWPRSSSSFLAISFSLSSEKEMNWSKAFLLTCEYFFNSVLAFSSCLNSCFCDMFLYLLKASVGKEPNSRIFLVQSSILVCKEKLLKNLRKRNESKFFYVPERQFVCLPFSPTLLRPLQFCRRFRVPSNDEFLVQLEPFCASFGCRLVSCRVISSWHQWFQCDLLNRSTHYWHFLAVFCDPLQIFPTKKKQKLNSHQNWKDSLSTLG